MSATTIDPERQAAFVGRLFAATSGALELATIYLGERLGLYRALADNGPMCVPELAGATATAERYVREWLEAQAVCGFVEVDDPWAAADERRYALPPEHADALLNRESLAYLAPMARFMPASAGAMRQLIEAFRTGGGVPYDVITMFDSLHHVPRPLEALRAMRSLVADEGTVLIVECRTAEHFRAPLPPGDFERFSYLVSLVHCLPTAMADQPSAGMGAIVRAATVRELAAQAGFSEVEVAPIEHPMLRFYRLRP